MIKRVSSTLPKALRAAKRSAYKLRDRAIISRPLLRKGAGSPIVWVREKKPSVQAGPPAQLYREGFTRFVMGDFAAIAEDVADADVVTLGRVVCCYPDAATLLREAAVRTRRILAFTYPRNRWYVRAVNVLQNFWRKVRGSTFQTFVHVPMQMERTLEDAGLVRVAQKGTAVWMLDVYEREVD
jgi:hypothetical protein